MEREKPDIKEIFYALTGEATYRDWDIEILGKADPEKTQKVISLLQKGFPFSEVEIEVEKLMEGGEKDVRTRRKMERNRSSDQMSFNRCGMSEG